MLKLTNFVRAERHLSNKYFKPGLEPSGVNSELIDSIVLSNKLVISQKFEIKTLNEIVIEHIACQEDGDAL